jgi:hypothetical protein
LIYLSPLNATGQIEFQPDLFLPKNVSLAKLQKANNHRSSYEIFKRAYSVFYECQKQRCFSTKLQTSRELNSIVLDSTAAANDDCSFVSSFAWCFFENVPEMKQLMFQYKDSQAVRFALSYHTHNINPVTFAGTIADQLGRALLRNIESSSKMQLGLVHRYSFYRA